MPTYEYACKKCGEHLEVVQSFKDEPLTECPACEGPLRKVFGTIGIAFKGSGFYKNDSRSAAEAAKPAAAGAKPSSDGAGSDGSGGSGGSSGSGGSEAGGSGPTKSDKAPAVAKTAASSGPTKPASSEPSGAAAS